MTFKSILVHLEKPENTEKLLSVATDLAQQSEGHLTGLFVLPPVFVPAMPEMAIQSEVWEAHRNEWRALAQEAQSKFSAATANRPFTSEWRFVDAGTLPVPAVVVEQAQSVDLAIVSRVDASGRSSVLDTPERTAMESGRPVLVVPGSGRLETMGTNVLVAWNGRKEAARAVFDAVPLLKQADKVHILTIESAKETKPGQIPGADIALALARHGVKCEVATTVVTDLSVANAMLNFVSDHGVDLIVMGCYGHTRLREVVFGGASRAMFAQATAPVFMSH